MGLRTVDTDCSSLFSYHMGWGFCIDSIWKGNIFDNEPLCRGGSCGLSRSPHWLWGVNQQPLYSGINPSWKRNYVLSRVSSKHLHLFSTEVFRQQSEQEIMYTVFLAPGHLWHPAPFPIRVPLAPCLSQGTMAKAIISSCKRNWNHLPLWEFLSCYLNMGCLAGGREEFLFILVFTFNLWECLMEAQSSNAECTAMWWQKVQRCVP